MSENGLIERILSDAQTNAEALISNATSMGVQNVATAQNSAMELYQSTDVKLKEECKQMLVRKATVAEIDAKKSILKSKVDCVDATFDLALSKLCKMDKKSYTDFVLQMLTKYADEGDAIVLSKNSPADKDAITKSGIFVDKKLSFAKNCGDFLGGLVLVGKNYDKSLTFETLLNQQKSQLQTEVFEKLM